MVQRLDETRRAEPLYHQIAQSFERQIENGTLTVRDRLPSVRGLSRQLGVSIGTAVAAYELLERQGAVVVRFRSGYFVADRRPVAAEPRLASYPRAPTRVALAELLLEIQANSRRPGLFPFGEAILGAELLPTSRFNRAVRKSSAAALAVAATRKDLTGSLRLRRQLARLAHRASVAATPEEVIVTSGTLEALHLALRAVTRPGDVVGVESPQCFTILRSLESVGLNAVEIPVQPRQGPDLERLETTIRKHRIRALLISGCCHSPIGYDLPDDVKADLVALAERLHVPIVEDDCFGDLSYAARRPKPFKAFDSTGGVLYCGTYSDLVAPGFPFGWIYPGRFQSEVEALRAITSTPASLLTQLAFAEFLEAGAYERYLRKLHRILAHSTRSLAAAVTATFPAGTRLVQPDGGLFLWIQLPNGLSGLETYRAALEQGLAIVPGIVFSVRRQHSDFIRLTCGWEWSDRAERAVAKLGALVERLARRASSKA